MKWDGVACESVSQLISKFWSESPEMIRLSVSLSVLASCDMKNIDTDLNHTRYAINGS